MTSPLKLRPPPHSPEAERALLGSVILDPLCLGEIGALRDDDFYHPAHRIVWRHLRRLAADGAAIDVVTLAESLMRPTGGRGPELQAAGGLEAIAELTRATPTAANAAYYAKIIRQRARTRAALAVARDVLRRHEDGEEDATILASRAREDFGRVLDDCAPASVADWGDDLRGWFRAYESAATADPDAAPEGWGWGLSELDRTLGRAKRGQLVVVAARPKVGKTALATQAMASFAGQGASCALFELEMRKGGVGSGGVTGLIGRMVAQRSGVPLACLADPQRAEAYKPDGARQAGVKRRSEPEDQRRVLEALKHMKSWRLAVDDSPRQTPSSLSAAARVLARRLDGLDVLFVDYLQLLEPDDPKSSEEQRIAHASREMKLLAKELDCCVVALAQLNRACLARKNKRPIMSDLRGSGAVEQDADVIAGIYRASVLEIPDDAAPDVDPQRVDPAEVITLAHRHQAFPATAHVGFVGESVRVVGVSGRAEPTRRAT